MKKISIVVPAYNEEKRIRATLENYAQYFDNIMQSEELRIEFVVVLNGCVDATLSIVQEVAAQHKNILIIETPQAGKGLAITLGFQDALTRENDLIGFVDADMATRPPYFHDLIKQIGEHNGIIASRYMKDAQLYPPRPLLKRWGSYFFYDSLVRLLFGISYDDTQCGAKLFTKKVIATITPHLAIEQWAFDVELLYLCKLYHFKIKEIPTVWYDQDHSKLNIFTGGIAMPWAMIKLRKRFFSLW